ncbi:MAG: hypothetical protein JST_000374 [Candidatus Parcubacteria bacterium]|nr:MAG: hypothetical protein JST_3450 [Candidatus Parcubacteria bacterium]
MKTKKNIQKPLWFSVSASANLGGVDPKTIRRAIKKSPDLKYKIINDRYRIELGSLLRYLNANRKLKNKLYEQGLGQYYHNWETVIESDSELG